MSAPSRTNRDEVVDFYRNKFSIYDVDWCMELSADSVEFLKKIFFTYDVDCDGSLGPAELEVLFSKAPGKYLWNEAPYVEAAEKTALGGLSLDGFLSLCFVFGPKGSGKSALLNSFIGRYHLDVHMRTFHNFFIFIPTIDSYEICFIHFTGLSLKSMFHQLVTDMLLMLLNNPHSCESSWEKAKEMLVDVASQGKATGNEVPCLIVAAKDDLEPSFMQIQDSTRVSQDMGIEEPIPLSTKLGYLSNIFLRIVTAAQHAYLTIPETSAGESRISIPEMSAGESRISIPETSAGKSRISIPKSLKHSGSFFNRSIEIISGKGTAWCPNKLKLE